MGWSRIYPDEPGIDGHNAIERRIYGFEGRDFPRISIAIYGLAFKLDRDPNDALRMVRKDLRPDSIKIAILAKGDEDDFPETATLPLDLVDELKDMLENVRNELNLIERARAAGEALKD